MYLLFSLRTPHNLASLLEEEFYFNQNLSWETEETDNEIIFKFYFPFNLKSKDQEVLTWLENLSARYQEVIPEYTLVKREDWEVIWKYHFKPLRAGRRLWVLPTWEEFSPQEEAIPIYIDPGQAFGTGHHPTTQLMLENLEVFLEKICEEESAPFVLDMGCGSGILSIAVAKLCPKASILAIDIDELALEATQKNAEVNQVLENIKIQKEISPSEHSGFHLIMANIGFRELKTLATLFREILHPQKGILLLSGVLKEDLPELERYYKVLGFRKIKSELSKGWALVSLRVI